MCDYLTLVWSTMTSPLLLVVTACLVVGCAYESYANRKRK